MPVRADAATVQAQSEYGRFGPENSVTVLAAPGEANLLEVVAGSKGAVVRDAGAPLLAGPGCTQLDGTVRCTIAHPLVLVDAGDGDDRATVLDGTDVAVDGGPGNDVLTARSEGVFRGGDGDDLIVGDDHGQLIDPGPGADTVLAGGGEDTVYAGGDGISAVADRLDGGPGRDRIAYEQRPQPVSVDLEHQEDAGSPGEHDVLSGFEDASGGDGDDVLLGDDGPNRLDSLGGRDRIEGRAGNDVLDGEGVLAGGPGDDQVLGGSGSADGGEGNDTVSGESITCGRGEDLALVQAGRVARDCERLHVDHLDLRRRPGAWRVRFRTSEPRVPCQLLVAVDGRRARPLRLSRAWRTLALPRALGHFTLRFDDGCGPPLRSRFSALRFEIASKPALR